jgi:hypothetical protein
MPPQPPAPHTSTAVTDIVEAHWDFFIWYCTYSEQCRAANQFGTRNRGANCRVCGIPKPGTSAAPFRMGPNARMVEHELSTMFPLAPPAPHHWIERTAHGVWIYFHDGTYIRLPEHLQTRENFRFRMENGRWAEVRASRQYVHYHPDTLEFVNSEISDSSSESEEEMIDPSEDADEQDTVVPEDHATAARTTPPSASEPAPAREQQHQPEPTPRTPDNTNALVRGLNPGATSFSPRRPNNRVTFDLSDPATSDYGTSVPVPRFNPDSPTDYGTPVFGQGLESERTIRAEREGAPSPASRSPRPDSWDDDDFYNNETGTETSHAAVNIRISPAGIYRQRNRRVGDLATRAPRPGIRRAAATANNRR